MSTKRTFAILVLAPLIGCSTERSVESTIGFYPPAPWRDRTAYPGVQPANLLYASDASAARESRETLDSIAGRFPYFQSEPVRMGYSGDLGVIVVVDAADAPMLPDDAAVFEVFVRGYAAMGGFPSPTERQLTETRERFARLGEPANSLLTHLLDAMPWAITLNDAKNRLNMPTASIQHADWIARYPTKARIRAAVDAMVPKMLDHAEKTGDLSAVGRFMVNPLQGLIRSKLANEFIEQRDRAMAEIARQCDPAWIAVRDARRDSMKDWRVLAAASSRPERVRAVLRRAETARQLAPDDMQVMRVWAAALYRAGEYAAALAAYESMTTALASQRQQAQADGLSNLATSLMPNLGNSLQRNIDVATRLQPVDLAFRAMTLANLSRIDDAEQDVKQLDERLKNAGPQPQGAKAIYAEARRTVKILREKANN